MQTPLLNYRNPSTLPGQSAAQSVLSGAGADSGEGSRPASSCGGNPIFPVTNPNAPGTHHPGGETPLSMVDGCDWARAYLCSCCILAPTQREGINRPVIQSILHPFAHHAHESFASHPSPGRCGGIRALVVLAITRRPAIVHPRSSPGSACARSEARAAPDHCP